jgi:hypothetical protein
MSTRKRHPCVLCTFKLVSSFNTCQTYLTHRLPAISQRNACVVKTCNCTAVAKKQRLVSPQSIAAISKLIFQRPYRYRLECRVRMFIFLLGKVIESDQCSTGTHHVITFKDLSYDCPLMQANLLMIKRKR